MNRLSIWNWYPARLGHRDAPADRRDPHASREWQKVYAV